MTVYPAMREDAAKQNESVLEKELLFTLIKVFSVRRIANNDIWLQMLEDVLVLLPQINLVELGILLDCYFKIGLIN